MATRREDVVRRAAIQCVRYERWSREQNARRRASRHHTRRREDAYRAAHPPPRRPRRVDKPAQLGEDATDEDRAAYEAALSRYNQYVEVQRVWQEWEAGLEDARRDRRGPGHVDRRNMRFPERTGEVVIRRYVGKGMRNVPRWCELAGEALELAKTDELRAVAGRVPLPGDDTWEAAS